MRTDELPPAQAPTVSTPAAEALNPVDKTKLVVPTEEGEMRCRELFEKHFYLSLCESVKSVDLTSIMRRWI